MTWFRKSNTRKPSAPSVELAVQGMHCASCGLLVDDELEEVPGVAKAATNVRTARSTVVLDDPDVDTRELIAAVERAGYQATLVE